MIYPKAFEIVEITNIDKTRIVFKITYQYNYNGNDDSYTNKETYTYNIPIEEFSMVCELDVETSVSSLELNAKNQCMFRMTNESFDYTNQWTDPLGLYQYIVQNIIA